MLETKIEKIEVIVKEHLDKDPMEIAIAGRYGVKPKGSTVGVKILAGGQLYGNYICFTQPTLSASEVAEGVNEVIKSVLEVMEKNVNKEA